VTDASDQVAYRRQDEVDHDDGLTDTEIYQGELEAGRGTDDDVQGLEDLADLDLRSGETDDPDVAAEEGLVYVPPIDPPVAPSADSLEGLEIAAGFGSSALDEPYDADHHSELLSDEDEMASRVREALRADSATSRYADDIIIGTRGGTVVLRGRVEDLVDTDEVVAVAERVTGVDEVIEELEVDALG
jgi:hypothetical protein